ncbi:nuclear transport factor 2 family protein [Marixanthomonas ophiurae]|uniref:Nuclear transport factor 2 family protein n=1 Tax=Marixanthomonas ophiurae TaxID=387659 RepID=A0A3E1Q8M2_9FLAO|nr:nuclear transport factor 2 family protein [Marixanthomonas ophiurae]RFN58483.1 nuclear transport factor 2 family protein [Marixanthomonas ophiurae]
MTRFLFVFSFLCSSIIFAQGSFSEKDAQQVIDTFFEGFHEGDTVKMKSVMAPDMIMQRAFTDKNGVGKISTGNASDFIMSIAKRPADQKWEEKILDYKINIDGSLAHVWTPYEFWFNEEFSHCGANAFTLAKIDNGWKIIHIIDSRRTADCN